MEASTPLSRALHGARQRLRRNGLWQHADFMRLWSGQTISQFGSTITREALPYTAILALHATPMQLGVLGAASTAPLLIIGLFAGVWVDRLRRRPLMIAADLARALLLLSVPLAYVLGVLTIEQLYVVAALAGILTVFFDVAYQAFLPSLLHREQLVEGNSKLGVSHSLAEIAGPPLGGALVQLISGPITVLFDALSFVGSALFLARIRTVEPPHEHVAERPRVWHDLGTGLRAVWSSGLLRAITISSAIWNFFGWFFGAIYVLYALDTLGMSTTMVGVTVACGGIGALLGTLVVEPLTQRFGLGTTTTGAVLVGAAASSLIWLASDFPHGAVPLMVLSQLIGDMAVAVSMINLLSLRQSITPDHLLGRVSASMEVLGTGVGSVGLLVGGALATSIGLRATVAVAVLGMLAGRLVLVFSPVRRVREMPKQIEQD